MTLIWGDCSLRAGDPIRHKQVMYREEIHVRFEKDVFGLQVAVYEACFFEHSQCVEELCGEDFDELCAEPLELVLLDEFVEVR